MELKIHNKVSFNENEPDYRSNTTPNMFDFFYQGDSDKEHKCNSDCHRDCHKKSNDDFAKRDFKISNVNKLVYDLKKGNTFDSLIIADILKLDSIDELVSLHIFCYESTSVQPFKIPMRFDVTIEDSSLVLGSMTEFSLGNIKGLSSDIRINNIVVPVASKATLVIIAATKQD